MKTIAYLIIIFLLCIIVYGLFKTDKNFNKLYKPSVDKIQKELKIRIKKGL